MTITGKARQDLEYEKFQSDSSGNVAVNVKVSQMPSISLTTGDIEIGAVELKDSASDNRATITSGALRVFDAVANSLVPSVYDYIGMTYTGSNIATVTFKTGGVSGTTVSTLSLGYSGNNLVSVTKS